MSGAAADAGSPVPRAVVVEADGGSRGNPGDAAYGAVLKDGATGAVIAERAERIGVASNNVAEYRGLIAGLELYHEHAEGAALEVRMDSKLVVEQMSGRWKIKHPSMKPMALRANRLAPAGTRYTWIPRELNGHADRLANLALDGPEGVVHHGSDQPTTAGAPADDTSVGGHPAESPPRASGAGSRTVPVPPWLQEAPTILVLVRHGETEHTRRRLFSGRAGADPGLSEEGRAQVVQTAEWLGGLAGHEPVVLASPMRRTRETAEVVSSRLETSFTVDEGLLEASFGSWEGLTYEEVVTQDRDGFITWLADADAKAGGDGDSLTGVADRMREVGDRLLATYAGRVVVCVSHLTPIKLLAARAMDLPLSALFRTEVAPASVTVLAWFPDGRATCRLLNGRPGQLVIEPAHR